MSWKQINGGDYLYRKVKGSNRSLGPMSEATKAAHAAFHSGRDRIRGRRSGLAGRLDEMAPVNRALGIARVPTTGARVLRSLAVAGLMGKSIDIVGTNALFAYERMAVVQVESGLLATGDIDLLFDSRRNLKLISPGHQRQWPPRPVAEGRSMLLIDGAKIVPGGQRWRLHGRPDQADTEECDFHDGTGDYSAAIWGSSALSVQAEHHYDCEAARTTYL